EQKKFFALIGAAEATPSTEEYVTNYTTKSESGFLLPSSAGKQAHTIAIAAALDGRENAEATYRLLAARSGSLQKEAAKKYQNYLQQTISLTLPDPKLQCTYDWSRISMLQGFVTNPLLRKSSAARACSKSPSESSANEVHRESRPKNQAKPGRADVPEV